MSESQNLFLLISSYEIIFESNSILINSVCSYIWHTVERQLFELPVNQIISIKECICQTNTTVGLYQIKCLKMLIYNYIY
jgi:hypothetical protein